MSHTISYTLSQSELPQLIERLVKLTETKQVFTFIGTLGAGKTTLIQGLCKALKVTEPISSPTYTYMNVYRTYNLTIYHFDLYRLTSYHDFVEAGFEEYLLQPNSLCLIEWPEIVIPHIAPESLCSLFIDYQEEKRCYTLSYS